MDERLLDEAVLRVLELKFKRGLFEHPYMEENMLEAEEAGINAASLKTGQRVRRPSEKMKGRFFR